MRPRYHAHFTIKPSDSIEKNDHIAIGKEFSKAAGCIGGKETIVQLETGAAKVIDPMITKYYNATGINESDTIIKSMIDDLDKLMDAGFTVDRWKLEKEIRFELSHLEDCMYFEVHQPCLVETTGLESFKASSTHIGWRPSNNIRTRLDNNRVVQFLSRRFHKDTAMEDIVAEIKRLTHVLTVSPYVGQILPARLELVLVDSNVNHDKWWCAIDNAKIKMEC